MKNVEQLMGVPVYKMRLPLQPSPQHSMQSFVDAGIYCDLTDRFAETNFIPYTLYCTTRVWELMDGLQVNEGVAIINTIMLIVDRMYFSLGDTLLQGDRFCTKIGSSQNITLQLSVGIDTHAEYPYEYILISDCEGCW